MNILVLTISLLIVTITMATRIRDMKGCSNLKECLHMIGCIMCAALPILWLASLYYTGVQPSPMLTGVIAGWAIVHLTTHHQRPWHKWVWRGLDE